MPGAFCMMSFCIVRQNLSWPRIFLCFFSRNLFLSSTSHMVNRFSRDGATLSSACSGSTLPARTSTLETKFGDVTVQIKCKSRVLLPISDCCRGRWCSPRGSWRAGSWRRGAWRSPSCGRAAPGTCPRPADTRQYKKLFSFLSYCELLKITHNNNLPLSGPGVSPTSFPSSVHWASWLYPTEDLCCCSRSSSGSVTKLPLSLQGGCGRGQMES